MRAAMSPPSPAERANKFLRQHDGAREAFARLSGPARNAALPVLFGNGRGLKVRTGPSTLMRLVSSVEKEVESVLLDQVIPGQTVYDVGANIGWFSLLAARKVGPSGRVVAFEPSIANASFATKNAVSNGFDDLLVVPAAVSDEDGWATFSNETSLKGKLSASGGVRVPVLSLDHWIAQTGERPPQVVKIDVEGAEGSALRGMRETLREHRPTLIIELHDTGGEVADFLDDVGYSHQPIDHGAPTREAPWWVHVLATPA